MKFFHISDLHLGIKLRGRSLIEDQRHILKQIVERAAEENSQTAETTQKEETDNAGNMEKGI